MRNRSGESRIVAFMFTKGQVERWRAYWDLLTSGSCWQSIKTFLIHGALKQGLCSETHVTALADGAKNCWTVLGAIQPYCATLECILDWFHIGKKFQTVQNAASITASATW